MAMKFLFFICNEDFWELVTLQATSAMKHIEVMPQDSNHPSVVKMGRIDYTYIYNTLFPQITLKL